MCWKSENDDICTDYVCRNDGWTQLLWTTFFHCMFCNILLFMNAVNNWNNDIVLCISRQNTIPDLTAELYKLNMAIRVVSTKRLVCVSCLAVYKSWYLSTNSITALNSEGIYHSFFFESQRLVVTGNLPSWFANFKWNLSPILEACNFPPGVKYRCDEEFDCLDFADERGCGGKEKL